MRKSTLELSLGPYSASFIYFLPLYTPHSSNIPYWDLLGAKRYAKGSHTNFPDESPRPV